MFWVMVKSICESKCRSFFLIVWDNVESWRVFTAGGASRVEVRILFGVFRRFRIYEEEKVLG